MPKLKYKDVSSSFDNCDHGQTYKDLVVLHETISPDLPGWRDIDNNVSYLASKGYGIHALTDLEGNIAVAKRHLNSIFWQAGGVNTRSIGVEQISKGAPSKWYWVKRSKQLHATAKFLAAWHNLDPQGHPLVYCRGRTPGVTSHWDVSQNYSASAGHYDCRPVHKGGYYPILSVIKVAKAYAKLGYRF